MQLRLPWSSRTLVGQAPKRVLVADGQTFAIDVVRHRRARRYIMRVTPAGVVRLTVPRGASIADGLVFAQREAAWVVSEWARLRGRAIWATGTTVWLRGAQTTLDVAPLLVTCGTESLDLPHGADVRVRVQSHLRALATQELPERCRLLAATHGIPVTRVSVRDQRSRWGACSSRRAITLNWRLIQMPASVADYVILHELAHIAHPNHSRRFWRHVASLCSTWRESERWLRTHGRELL